MDGFNTYRAGGGRLPGYYSIPATKAQRKHNEKLNSEGLTLCSMKLEDAVCRAYNVSLEELRGKCRRDEIKEARYAEAAYLYFEQRHGKRRIARIVGIHQRSPGVTDRLNQHESLYFTVPVYKAKYDLLCMFMQVDTANNDDNDNNNFR